MKIKQISDDFSLIYAVTPEFDNDCVYAIRMYLDMFHKKKEEDISH